MRLFTSISWPVLAGALIISGCITNLARAQDILGRLNASYRGHFSIHKVQDIAVQHRRENPKYPSCVDVSLWPDTTEFTAQYLVNHSSEPLFGDLPAVDLDQASQRTIDTHVRWLKQYGINGLMVMRPVPARTPKSATYTPRSSLHQQEQEASRSQCLLYSVSNLALYSVTNDSATNVAHERRQNAALHHIAEATQKRGSTFFVMYELATKHRDKEKWLSHLKQDLLTHIKPHIRSSSWALEKHKPVIGIKGIGFKGSKRSAADYLELIRFLRGQGFYVIGGVAADWREQRHLSSVFRQLDMIMPWSVGNYKDLSSIDNYAANHYRLDIEWTQKRQIDYLPVVWPGTSTANMPPISRRNGTFLWRQFYHLYNLGHDTAVVASLDGYDDGTAILKAASDSLTIPDPQKHQTLSGEGGTYLSSDFYLRLAGAGAQALQGTRGMSYDIPIVASAGPVWFRSGFEKHLDAATSWNNSVLQVSQISNARCEQVFDGQGHLGDGSIIISGTDKSRRSSYVHFRSINVDIPVNHNTQLNFWFKAHNKLGRYVSIELITTEGKKFSTKSLMSQDPNDRVGLGNRVGKWHRIHANIGQHLRGYNIQQVAIGYSCARCKGEFAARIDDIEITDEPMLASKPMLVSKETTVLNDCPKADTVESQTSVVNTNANDNNYEVSPDSSADDELEKYVVSATSLPHGSYENYEVVPDFGVSDIEKYVVSTHLTFPNYEVVSQLTAEEAESYVVRPASVSDCEPYTIRPITLQDYAKIIRCADQYSR